MSKGLSRPFQRFVRCPCGQVPTVIGVEEGSTSKYAWAYGNCCAEWNVEFRTNYKSGEELTELAIDAWNNTPRQKADGLVTLKDGCVVSSQINAPLTGDFALVRVDLGQYGTPNAELRGGGEADVPAPKGRT